MIFGLKIERIRIRLRYLWFNFCLHEIIWNSLRSASVNVPLATFFWQSNHTKWISIRTGNIYMYFIVSRLTLQTNKFLFRSHSFTAGSIYIIFTLMMGWMDCFSVFFLFSVFFCSLSIFHRTKNFSTNTNDWMSYAFDSLGNGISEMLTIKSVCVCFFWKQKANKQIMHAWHQMNATVDATLPLLFILSIMIIHIEMGK